MPLATRELAADLLVAGGGVAGVCCALAAARLGTRVILCQDRPVLGGNASSEVRMHIVGATGLHGGAPLREELREGGIIEELRLELAVRNPQRSPAMMDLALYDACRREPNLTLLLNTTVTGAEVRDGVIHAVRAERQSTEESFVIRARVFVDCTGDGRLGVEAGAAFVRGREDKGRHAESLAQDEADTKTLGSSIMFQARKHEREMPFVAPPWVRRFEEGDFRLRPYARSGFDLGLEYGWWWLEWGGCLDTIRDNERIRDELLAIALGVWDHVKNRSGVDASHWALEWIGFLPGKRESRRFLGQHVLTQNDVTESRPFPDAIAYGGWPIDTHPPEGIDAPDQPPCTQHEVPFLYDIPLRSCVSVGPRNLMFAGRNISATHIAFASTRVMATCAVVGQGVGTPASSRSAPMHDAPPSPGRAWLVVALLWVVAALNYLDRVMITTMRESLQEVIPMTDVQFGLLTSVFLWVYGLLSPLAGFLADRYSRSRIIVGSLLAWSLLTWLTGYATTFEQLVVVRGLMGVSEAAYLPAALALIADHHRGGTRSLATGIHMTGLSVGSGLGGVGGWLAERQGWSFAFGFFGMFGVAYAALLWCVIRDVPRGAGAGDDRSPPPAVNLATALSSLLGNRSFLLLLAYWGLFGLAGWAVTGWMPTFFLEQFDLQQGSAGIAATAYLAAAMFAGKLIGGAWADRWSRTNARGRILVPMIGMFVAAPAMLLVSSTGVLAVAIAGLSLFGMMRSFSDANLMPVLCQVVDPRFRGTGYGLLNLCACVVGGLAILWGGRLRDAGVPVSVLFQAAAVGLLICGVLLVWVTPSPER